MPLPSVVDHEVDPWVFSRKGRLGGIYVFIGGHVGCHSLNFSEIARKSKVGYATIEVPTVYPVTFFH